jgi:hypothetical protein
VILDDPSMVGAIGIIFNFYDSKNSWVIEVYSNGVYRIFSVINGSFVTTKQEASSSINKGSGAKNTIKVVQNTSSMDLYINNSLVENFTIPLRGGSFKTGIITSAPPASSPVAGQFNNFKLTRN